VRGDQHVLITLFSGGLLFVPHLALLAPWELGALTFGLFVGSLAPDADATDAAIFHTRVPGLPAPVRRLVDGFSRVLPVFGYVIRYCEYYPAAGVFWLLSAGKLRAGHRGILHSLLGIGLCTAMTGLYLLLGLHLLGWSAPGLLVFGVAGFGAGTFLHLAEDSCTPRGIAWLYPLSHRRVRGRVRSGSRRDPRPGLFAGALGCATGVCLVLEFLLGTPVATIQHLSVFLFVGLWTTFRLSVRS